MKIASVRIQNFRGISQLELDLDKVTVLIGENNSGKTSVLDALRLCLRELGPRRRPVFDLYDFHLPSGAAEPSSVDPIQIDIRLSEQEQFEWNEGLVARLNRAGLLQVNENGLGLVHLRVSC